MPHFSHFFLFLPKQSPGPRDTSRGALRGRLQSSCLVSQGSALVIALTRNR